MTDLESIQWLAIALLFFIAAIRMPRRTETRGERREPLARGTRGPLPYELMPKKQKPKEPNGSAGEKPAKVPQKHGGALYAGGVPGNRGPRISSEVRSLFMGDLLVTREHIGKTIGNREPCPLCGRRTSDADLIRLADFFAKYSIGAAKAALEPGLLIELAEAVQRTFDAEPEQMEALYKAWAPTLGRHAAGEA